MRKVSRNPSIDLGKVAIIALLALGSLAVTTACVYPEGYYGRSGQGQYRHGHRHGRSYPGQGPHDAYGRR